VLQEKLGVQNFLGLTATATLSTASDVARHLKISDFRKATVRGSPIPKNLILSVSRDEDREHALVGLLKGERFGKLDSIIIYCTRRDQTDKVATIIRTCMNTGAPTEVVTKGRSKRPKLEWDAESYHAGLTPAQRKRVQNNFMSGKLRVVVATVAFGMGLDKSDVRGVIHYNMPKSFESYVQEIGRAGRDGERADCHVFLDPEYVVIQVPLWQVVMVANFRSFALYCSQGALQISSGAKSLKDMKDKINKEEWHSMNAPPNDPALRTTGKEPSRTPNKNLTGHMPSKDYFFNASMPHATLNLIT
ncbi:ATP-dependent DNA helicase Q4-like, partial [Ruditapes philippinarum]|uniref:ATP-dependent DNA helicase Q4-like n=1 Tax=Ruditapes philippinarum TaxID=129788 RepID=UPI00295B8636